MYECPVKISYDDIQAKMPRYIDAEKLKQDIIANSPFEYGQSVDVGVDEILELIDEQPTADVKEVMHGEWVVKTHFSKSPFTNESGLADENFCPFCKRRDHNGDGSFCGYCGAKMDGGAGA